MRIFIFPRGLAYSPPSDKLGHAIGALIMNPTATRERLSAYIYKTQESHNPLGQLQEALIMSTMAEPLEKRIRVEGVKTGRVTAPDLPGQILEARALSIISEAEAGVLQTYDKKVLEIINVDDFAPHELGVGADAAS
jgi:acyl-CoA dehydrogenase